MHAVWLRHDRKALRQSYSRARRRSVALENDRTAECAILHVTGVRLPCIMANQETHRNHGLAGPWRDDLSRLIRNCQRDRAPCHLGIVASSSHSLGAVGFV